MRFLKRPPLWRILLLVLVGAALVAARLRQSQYFWLPRLVLNPRVIDEVGLLDRDARIKHEEQLAFSQHESGIDIRYLIVPTTGRETIEQFAVRRARELGLGRDSDRRGVLIVYDTLARRMRIEVGPMLQGILPDGFVGYLMREHNRAFFGHSQPELGLRLTQFMLDWRIRAARLGEEYDPAFEQYIRDVQRLATGGGASGRVELGTGDGAFINERADSAARARFSPQPSVEGTYLRYLEWAALGRWQADVPLFTSPSQRYLASLPMTSAFNAAMLALEYRKSFAVDVRGGLAMLYFTDTPFRSPLFFRHTAGGWQMDVLAEIANSQEVVGGWYSWTLVDSGDEFSAVFADRYMPVSGTGFREFYRVAGGDNRWLPVRNTRKPVEWVGAPVGPAPDIVPAAVEQVTVSQLADRIRAVRERPSVVLLYNTRLSHVRDNFSGIVALAVTCSERGIEFLAFSTDEYGTTLDQLPAFLAQRSAPFAPAHVYPWKRGLLDATLGALGIQVGQSWTPPLVAVRDRDGRIVAQGQGVTDWEAVIAAARKVAP